MAHIEAAMPASMGSWPVVEEGRVQVSKAASTLAHFATFIHAICARPSLEGELLVP
jgi:hypothetical protein